MSFPNEILLVIIDKVYNGFLDDWREISLYERYCGKDYNWKLGFFYSKNDILNILKTCKLFKNYLYPFLQKTYILNRYYDYRNYIDTCKHVQFNVQNLMLTCETRFCTFNLIVSCKKNHNISIIDVYIALGINIAPNKFSFIIKKKCKNIACCGIKIRIRKFEI
jgi:hypothetical protein